MCSDLLLTTPLVLARTGTFIDVAPGTGMLELGAMEDEVPDALGHPFDVITSGHGRMQHIHEEAIKVASPAPSGWRS